jgi:gliding motility-associated-like protein
MEADLEPVKYKDEPISLATGTEENAQALAPTVVVVGDFCGQGTGFIDITPDPNTPGPWTYIWSNGATTEDINGLTAGTYTVIIRDANGDGQIEEIVVVDLPPAGPTNTHIVATGNTSCTGPFDGALQLTVNPLANWTYLWSTGATTTTISGLNSGIYTVSVTFGVTCTTVYEFEVPNAGNPPIIVLPPPANGTTPSTCEQANGVAGVVIAGGVAPFTYLWSNGGTNVAIQNVLAGTYTITVTGSNGCTSSESITVENVNWPIVIEDEEVILIPNTTCIGGNGSISIPIVHPIIQGPFSYLWDNGETTQNLTNLPSGSYRVTVSYNAACFTSQVFFIEHEPLIPDITFNNTSTTCGFSNGFVNLTVLPGGTPAYTYLWSNGATTQDLTNVPADTYEVVITGVNGCTFTGSATIDDNPILFDYSAVVTDQFACDTTNGQINLSLFPSTLSYQWSNGATGTINRNLAPGDYTVTISAGGTCTAVETFNVGDVTEYPIIPVVPQPSSCGLSNGAVDLSIFGNAALPLTYLWSNGATSQDLGNVPAGTYNVTVTSAVGCTATNIAVVPNINDTIRILGNVVDNFSCTTPTGNIALEITPLDTSYTYIWSSGQTTDSLSNLTAGVYLVTVTLGNTCIGLDTFEVINNALPPNPSALGIAANCSLNNGAADLNVTGGTAPFSFLWSNTETTEDLANLTPGTYTVTITGANDCTSVHSVNVPNNNTNPDIDGNLTQNTSCLAANGALDIGVSPSAAYNYLWSNAATTEDLNNLSPGTYTVTVSLGSCLSTSSFLILDDAQAPNLSASGTSANCGLNDGSVALNVSGGMGPFTYLWSNAATDEDLNGIPPGAYTVTVTGSNGCTALNLASVLNNDIPLNINAIPVGNASCTINNGALDINVAPAGNYTYLWSNAATDEDLSNLPAGTYTVTVSLGTCQSSSSFSVADDTESPNLATNIVAAICSEANGSIDLNVGGTPGPYTYLWSNQATTEDVNALLPGNYFVTVTAPNGCTEVASINVPNDASDFSLAGTSAPLTDCAAANGAIDLNVIALGGGTFTYLWSNMATTEDIGGLTPGVYTVSVTQSGSCTATASYFVVDQRTNPLSSQLIVPEFCGLADGSIDLSVSSGTAPYAYLWETGQITQDLANLSAGIYTVTVTDANNCTVTSSAVVPGNNISFTLAGTASANSSCIQNNGAIDLNGTAGGGTFTYLWSNMATTEDLNAINAGTYTVTVSAGGNCTNTAVFIVTSDVPIPILAQNIAAAACGQADGNIDLSVTGSPAPHQFLWSNAAMVEDLVNVISGSYSVTVTAANGCTTVEQYTVPENSFAPTINSALTTASSCVINNGAIDLSITPAMSYTFIWSGGQTDEDLSNLAAGTYTVTVSAGGACTNTAILTVASDVPLPLLSNNIEAATCGEASGSIDLSVSGSPAPFDYLWSNAAQDEDLNNLLSGAYTVTVTASNGCSSVESFTVPENTILPAIIGSPTAANSCLVFNGSIVLSVNFVSGYTILWSNGSVAEDLANLSSGSYTVTVNGGGDCISTATFAILDQTTQPQASIQTNTTALDCSTISTTLNGSVTGTPNPASLQWFSNGTALGNGNTLNVNTPGQYVLVVLDEVTACADTVSIAVSQSLNPPALFVANPALLTCTNPSQTLSGSSSVGNVQFAWASIMGTDTTILNSSASLLVNTPGTYFLLGINPANNCGNAVSVNILADQMPPGANAGHSFTLDCAGETAALNGSGSGAPNLTYQWTTSDGHFVSGATSPTPLIDEAGTYVLQVTNVANGCTATAEVTIEPEVPVAYASVVQPNCLNPLGSIRIDSVTGLSDPILYSLNNQQPGAQNQFINLPSGAYTVAVLGDNGCNASTTVTVDVPVLMEVTLTPTATIALGYSYQIDATVNIPDTEIMSVTWTPSESLECPGCLSTLATPFSTTQYQVRVVSNEGCEARGNIQVIVDKTRKVYGPNIFSPDGDGTNDVFTIFADPITVTKIRSLQVFSRWGEAVYEQRNFAPGDTNLGWDGTFKGQKMNPAVFVWQAVVEFVDGQEELFVGDIMLQR